MLFFCFLPLLGQRVGAIPREIWSGLPWESRRTKAYQMLVWYEGERCGFSQAVHERSRLRERISICKEPHQDRLSEKLPGRYGVFLRLHDDVAVHFGPTFGFAGHTSGILQSDMAIAILVTEIMDRFSWRDAQI